MTSFVRWGRLQSWRANQTDSVSLVSGIFQRKGSWWGKTQLQRSPSLRRNPARSSASNDQYKNSARCRKGAHSSRGGVERAVKRGRDGGRGRQRNKQGRCEILTKAF
ncbi:uncharacterized [Tachysurus ichikawai]